MSGRPGNGRCARVRRTDGRWRGLLALASVLPLGSCTLFGVRTEATPLLATDEVKQPFAPVVEAANRSVVTLRTAAGPVALATVVDYGGIAVTVAGELPDEPELLTAVQGDRSFAVERLGVDYATELAVLRLHGDHLRPIRWAKDVPPPGSFLASPDGGRLPAGIGILSTGVYVHTRPHGYLGVLLGAEPSPVRLRSVIDGSAAEESGLRAGDEILAIDDEAVADTSRFRNLVGGRRPGDRLHLRVRREGQELQLQVELRPDRRGVQSDQESVWGPLSSVRAGFAEVLQHDTVLRPEQCGGPVVDLDGRCIGVNVSRAGRVETLALPEAAVRAAIARVQD